MIRKLSPLAVLFLVAVPLLTGCATPGRSGSVAADRFDPGTRQATDDLIVVSSVYGSGESFADVSYRVNALIHRSGLVFTAQPVWLEADPTPGWNKALVVVYELKGVRSVFTSGEGGKVSYEALVRSSKGSRSSRWIKD
jgi:hypothetical protein